MRRYAQGKETWTLTAEGVQVARQLAMGYETTIDAILDGVTRSERDPSSWHPGESLPSP
jgi:hypothetical protein